MKQWVRPSAVIERFAANEYIAACGDLNRVYLFDCNAGNPGQRYDVETEDGKLLTADTPVKVNYFHPCGVQHEAPVDDEFLSGMLYETGGNDRRISASAGIPVIIWIDAEGDTHCTANLDISTWQTNRS